MHIRALDGVRGLAVLLVVFFHYGYVPFGWVGVQIFFVLSGYLITSILLTTKVLPLATYLGRFYWRRSLRIFPLYFAVLLASVVVYAIWKHPAGLPDDLPYLATYLTNFARLRPGDVDPAFVHLWSLAVEEQFYLLWPLFIYAVPERYLKLALTAIILGSPIIRLAIYFYFRDQPEVVGRAIYCLPFTQFDAFAFGAAIVVWKPNDFRTARGAFAIALAVTAMAGVATLAYTHLFAGGAFKGSLGYSMYLMPLYGFLWGYTLINILSVLGIVCLLQGTSAVSLFENKAMVYIGSISYGIYVFHVPILKVTEAALGTGVLAFVAYLAAVVGLSAASFRWLEMPFLRLKDRYRSLNFAAART